MAEEKYGYGCLLPKVDLRDFKVCSANVTKEYPKEFSLQNLPNIKSQGQINSCCAHATSSILEYYNTNKATLSTNFLYGIQKQLCGHEEMGMYLKDACKIAKTYGDPLLRDCPGNTEIPDCWKKAETVVKNKEIMAEAYKYRITSYYACNSDNDIKYALMYYGPVLGAILWKDSYTLDKDYVIHFDPKAQGGGHAVMIYGWNEKGWLIQNSWGTNFGNGGRFILPFNYGFYETRVLIDYDNAEDEALKKPCSNTIVNAIYKVINNVINFIIKR